MKRSKIYSDLDLTFKIHPLNNDINVLYDETAVIRSLKHIILTNAGDIPFHPEKIVGLRDLLFEPATFITLSAIKKRIEVIIAQNAPRVRLIAVEVTNDEKKDGVNVEIRFTTLNLIQEITTNLYLQRIR
jgi:phage baseplate assembly protein W